ncbi:MAG: GspF family T2SS innner membrane protein variant XcpS [Wenzhouxiangellaceae bacterium]
MAAFEYRALDRQREVRGLIQADSPRQARAMLRERGLLPLSVDRVARRATLGGRWRLARERALLLRQLASLLGAGLPLDEALAVAAEPAGLKQSGRAIAQIRSRVLEGASLSDAMAEHPDLFPELYRSSVAAAEQAGRLEWVLKRLADHAARQLELSRSLAVALVYPVLLAVISLLVVWGLLVFVVPRVVGVFEHARQSLPLMTQSLIWVSDTIARRWPEWLVLAIVVPASVVFALRSPRFRRVVDRWTLRLPLFGRIARVRAAAFFTRTLSILVTSGVPAVDALKAAAEVNPNSRIREDLLAAAERVRQGMAISAALEAVDWIPPLTRRLIRGGERAGELGEMLDHAADLHEAELADASAVLIAVLQPVLILLVGLIVLYIVLAILLPIMNLSQLLG